MGGGSELIPREILMFLPPLHSANRAGADLNFEAPDDSRRFLGRIGCAGHRHFNLQVFAAFRTLAARQGNLGCFNLIRWPCRWFLAIGKRSLSLLAAGLPLLGLTFTFGKGCCRACGRPFECLDSLALGSKLFAQLKDDIEELIFGELAEIFSVER